MTLTHNMNFHTCAGGCGQNGWTRNAKATKSGLVFSHQYQQWLCQECFIKVDTVAKRIRQGPRQPRRSALGIEIDLIMKDLEAQLFGDPVGAIDALSKL